MPKDESVSDAIFQALINHYWMVRGTRGLQPFQLYQKGHLIAYSTLCNQAGVPFMTQSAGGPLHDVAIYCNDHQWPPVNALAVNQGSRYSGPGYFEAPGCSNTLEGWVTDVEAVLLFDGYPKTAPSLP